MGCVVCTTQHLEGRIFHSESWTLLFIGNDGLINWSILKYTSVCSLGNCPTQWFSRVSPNPDTQCLASATFLDSQSCIFNAFKMSTAWAMLTGPISAASSRCSPAPWTAAAELLCTDLEVFPLGPREAQQPSLQWCWSVWDGLLKIVPFDLEVSECHF